MALTILSADNHYNRDLENLSGDDLLRRALTGEPGAANKVKGGPTHVFILTTTDATVSPVLDLAAARTVNNPISNLVPNLSLPGLDVTTAGSKRIVEIECFYFDSSGTTRQNYTLKFLVTGASTPTVAALTVPASGYTDASIALAGPPLILPTLVAGVGTLTFTVTGTAATNIRSQWRIKANDLNLV